MSKFTKATILFVAGLLSGVVGSTLATDDAKMAARISAADDGAWILSSNTDVRFCWTETSRTGDKSVRCTSATAP